MKELAEDYFKRDLSPEEEERLAQYLATSSEGPQRLIELAETHFRQLGVQEPEWHEGPLPSYFPKSHNRFLPAVLFVVIAFVLALMGYTAIRWLNSLTAPSPSSLGTQMNVPSDQNSPSSTLSNSSISGKRKAGRMTAPSSSPDATQASEGKISSTSPEEKGLNNPLPISSTAPVVVPLSSEPQGKLYEELSVVVDTAIPGLATVRVLDGQNNEIRLLYAGILSAGTRTFAWDGKDGDGKVVSAGVYYLVVNSGTKVMRQEVHVGQTP